MEVFLGHFNEEVFESPCLWKKIYQRVQGLRHLEGPMQRKREPDRGTASDAWSDSCELLRD